MKSNASLEAAYIFEHKRVLKMLMLAVSIHYSLPKSFANHLVAIAVQEVTWLFSGVVEVNCRGAE